jgi:methanogenic corrinoid protein MtbC1
MARSARSRGNAPGFSIQLVARAAGISADVLRMWERRYGYPAPARDERGNRIYSGDDIRRLQQIRQAMQRGFKPAEVVGKSEAELQRLVGKVAEAQQPLRADAAHGPVLLALSRGDAAGVRQLLRMAALSLGPKAFVVEVASPLVEEVGRMWEAGTLQVHHEHLVSDLLATQLRMLLSASEEGGEPAVAFTTLSGEQHTLGMWMAAVYAAAQGACVRVLGPDLPIEQILGAAEVHKPQVLAVSISPNAELAAARTDLAWLLSQLPPEVELWAGGKASKRLAMRARRFRALATWEELDRALAQLR